MNSSEERDQALDRILSAYRQSSEFGDPSVNFMPELWARIESRRSANLVFVRLARVFATGAFTVALIAASYVAFAPPPAPVEETWVENLANQQLAQRASYFEPVQIETAAYPGK